MARPTKDGIDYFPLDVGFLQDKKTRLIKGEYGAKGVIILLQILCSVYEGNGYFATWDDDDCILMSEGVGCGITPSLICEVVQGCIKRSIFDEGVFNVSGVLTSQGIQRRYLRAVSTRDYIQINDDYWLLDINNKKDVSASIVKKIVFKNVSLQINHDKTQINPVEIQINPQSKVKESKVKESKETVTVGENVFTVFQKCGFQITGYTGEELMSLSEQYTEAWVIESIKRAALMGKKSLAYIKGILSKWEVAGSMDNVKKNKTCEGRDIDDTKLDC